MSLRGLLIEAGAKAMNETPYAESWDNRRQSATVLDAFLDTLEAHLGDPYVSTAYVGWSNMRGGTEIYSEQSGDNGRWVTRRTGDTRAQEWGDLFADELAEAGIHEGARLVVIAVPSRFDPTDLSQSSRALVAALRAERAGE